MKVVKMGVIKRDRRQPSESGNSAYLVYKEGSRESFYAIRGTVCELCSNEAVEDGLCEECIRGIETEVPYREASMREVGVSE